MKYGLIGLLAMTSMAFAHQFPGPPGPNSIGCSKWSNLIFCKDWYGPFAHTTSEASRCKATHNADGWVIYLQYDRRPGHPPVPYKKIYVRKCLAKIYATHAPSSLGLTMATQVQAIIPNGAEISNSHITEEGDIKLYVIDTENEHVYEATFSEAGSMENMVIINPDENEYFLGVLETTGLEFATLTTE